MSQASLPFPPTPSASRAGRTMQESSYANRVQPRRLPEDAPNILIVLIDEQERFLYELTDLLGVARL